MRWIIADFWILRAYIVWYPYAIAFSFRSLEIWMYRTSIDMMLIQFMNDFLVYDMNMIS